MTKEINMRQYEPFDYLINEFEFNLAKAEYHNGYAGVESVWYENSKRDIRINVINDYRGEIDVLVEMIGSGQEFPISQIINFCRIRQLYLEEKQEIDATDETSPFPLKYSFKVQISKRMRKLASTLKYYAVPLLKGDNCFLSQLSEYCAVINGLYAQSCTKDRRNDGVTRLIENAIRNSDLTSARKLLLGLPLPLGHYEEEAIKYVEKLLKKKDHKVY
jgi:hypothetical protein